MFAVVKTGGKQYKVAEKDVITVESLKGEPGSMIALNDVLMMGGVGEKAVSEKGQLDKAAVFAEVLEQTRGDKVIVFKKKRRHNYRRKKGHRQNLTVLRILGISATGEKPKVAAKTEKPKPAAKEESKTEAAAEKKTAAKKKAPAKKAPAKKAPAKKAPAKKAAAKKSTAKKTGTKKAASKSKPKSKE